MRWNPFSRRLSRFVHKNPRELVDAIYPIMGPAIRASIAAAMQEFAEGLNQIMEKSASFRAITLAGGSDGHGQAVRRDPACAESAL